MLTKLIALVRGKVALAVLGVVLVGGGSAAVALAAMHSARPGQQHTSTASNDQNGKSADTNHGHTVSLEGVLKTYDAGGHAISVRSAGAASSTSVAVNADTRVNGEHA